MGRRIRGRSGEPFSRRTQEVNATRSDKESFHDTDHQSTARTTARPWRRRRRHHHFPVVKLLDPTGAATSLLSELDADGDTLFGLCDLGFGFPELGSVSLAELASVKGPLGLGIERDLHFQARFPISVHAEAARILRPRHRGRATAAAGSRRPIKAPFRASARHGGTAAPIGAKTVPPRRPSASAAGTTRQAVLFRREIACRRAR